MRTGASFLRIMPGARQQGIAASTTGVIDEAFVEIVSGVRAGERVATGGSYVLVAQLNNDKLGAGCTDD